MKPPAGMPFGVEILEECRMTPEAERDLRALLAEAFAQPFFLQSRHCFGSVPDYSVAARGEGGLLGAASVFLRGVRCGAVRVEVAGVGNVAVRPAARGSGVFGAVMRAAMAEAGRRGPSHGLLFCKPQIELLYARLGWTRRAGPVLAVGRDGRRGPLSSGDTAMTYRLRAAPFPEGELDLLGPRW